LVQSKSKGFVTIYRVPVNLELYIVFEKNKIMEGGMEVRVVGNYVLEKRIGSGPFSVMWRAGHIHHYDNKFAVKEISTGKHCRKLRDRLMLEIDILRQINHPNIIGFHKTIRLWRGVDNTR
jgi:serine/threonine protein kinase